MAANAAAGPVQTIAGIQPAGPRLGRPPDGCTDGRTEERTGERANGRTEGRTGEETGETGERAARELRACGYAERARAARTDARSCAPPLAQSRSDTLACARQPVIAGPK